MDKVSVITPVYNCENTIAQTIDSVLSQTYTDFELILVDDCSPDSSASIIKEYAERDNRIIYTKMPVNSRPALARNRGIEISKGRYIAFLDSDDVWLPDKLEKQIEFMNENEAAFSCTDYEQMNADGSLTGRIIKCKSKCSYNNCVWTNPIGNSTVILDTKLLGKVFIPQVENREDYAMWLMLLRTKTKYAYGLNEVLMHYRLSKNSFSSNKLQMAKHQYSLYRKQEHFSAFRAAFHVIMWGLIKILHIK